MILYQSVYRGYLYLGGAYMSITCLEVSRGVHYIAFPTISKYGNTKGPKGSQRVPSIIRSMIRHVRGMLSTYGSDAITPIVLQPDMVYANLWALRHSYSFHSVILLSCNHKVISLDLEKVGVGYFPRIRVHK